MLACVSCNRGTVVPVIVTTDIHGASLAKVASYIAETRSQNSDLVLLDNGDILQGTPALHYYNFIVDNKPHIVPQIMNHLKYDAGTIGNHDIEAGFKNCKRVEKEFNFPWMSANITLNETKMPLFTPYTIIERKGFKIAILSLSTLASQKVVRPEDFEIIKLNDLEQSAEKWMTLLKKDKNPDVVIGLFHEGLELAAPVVEKIAGFDIVFVGHDHLKHKTVLKGPDGSEVPVIGTKDRGKSVAYAEITFKKGKPTFNTKIVEFENTKESPEFIEFMKQFKEEIDNYELKPAAETPIDITPEIYLELIHTALIKTTEAEISISAPATKNPVIKAGTILMKDLFRLYPFDNHPVLLELSGKEIGKLLEYSKDLQQQNRPEKRFYNDLSAVYAVSWPLDNDKMYKVAMNSHHAYDGGNMLSKGIGFDRKKITERTIKIFNENIREHLFDH